MSSIMNLLSSQIIKSSALNKALEESNIVEEIKGRRVKKSDTVAKNGCVSCKLAVYKKNLNNPKATVKAPPGSDILVIISDFPMDADGSKNLWDGKEWVKDAFYKAFTANNIPNKVNVLSVASVLKCAKPKKVEMLEYNHCSLYLLDDILPQFRYVVPVGKIATEYLFNTLYEQTKYSPEYNVSYLRGSIIPYEDKFYICPLEDYLFYKDNPLFKSIDIENIVDSYKNNRPTPPNFYKKTLEFKQVHFHENKLTDEIKQDISKWFDKLNQSEKIGVDIEATGLRNFNNNLHCLSMSLSTNDECISFLYDHPTYPTPELKKYLDPLILKLFTNTKVLKIAHNCVYEVEWFLQMYGYSNILSVLDENNQNSWLDSYYLRYVLGMKSDKQFGRSLNDLTFQFLGFEIKPIMDIDRKNMIKYSIKDLLVYNSYDAIVLPMIYDILYPVIKYRGLENTLQFTMQAEIFADALHHFGLPVNFPVLEKLENQLTEMINEALIAIKESNAYLTFVTKQGKHPNLSSTPDKKLLLLYDGFLESEFPVKWDKAKKENRVTLDNKALKSLLELKDSVLLKNYLKYLDIQNKIVKFINPLRTRQIKSKSNNAQTVVFDDDRARTNIAVVGTITGRSASTGFNTQNIFKHNLLFKFLRQAIGPNDPENVIGQADLGGADVGGACVHSHDEAFIKARWNDEDVHTIGAKMLVEEIYPAQFYIVAKILGLDPEKEENHKIIYKDLRRIFKGSGTFAWIYGASTETMATGLLIPEKYASIVKQELNRRYPGIHTWHEKLKKFYLKHGYIKSVTGAIFYGPMTENDIFNYPLQHTTRYITAKAAYRIALKLYDQYGVKIINDIHDDIMTEFARKYKDEVMRAIAKEMCVPSESDRFLRVSPLMSEVSIGKDWYHVEETKVFSSRDFGINPEPIENFKEEYDLQFTPYKCSSKPIIILPNYK